LKLKKIESHKINIKNRKDMAQSKVTIIEPKTYQGKVTGHSIVLENGTKGYLDDKGSDKDIAVGETVEFTITVKQNKKGENYNLLTLKRASTVTVPASLTPTLTTPPKPLSVNLYPADIFDYKCEGIFKSMELVMKAVYEDKINFADVVADFNTIKGAVLGAIDEITGEV
jgi:hypothetical protein